MDSKENVIRLLRCLKYTEIKIENGLIAFAILADTLLVALITITKFF